MMANLSERDQRTLRYGGLGVGLILVLMLVLFPVMDAWDGLSTRVVKAKAKLSDIETGVTAAAEASNKGASLRDKATVYPNRAEVNQQTARMLQRIEALPGYDKLSVRRLEGLPLRDEGSFFRTGVSMQFSGTLTDLHTFVQATESARPILKVDRLTVAQDQKDASRIEGQVVINGFAVVTEKKGKQG
jgi:hypothetical protein